MALEIKNTNGEININGNASEGQITQVKNYLKALMTIKDSVLLNIQQVKEGQESLIKMIETIKTEIQDYQTIYYYGVSSSKVKQLYPINQMPVRIYLAA
ncbi:hypothetical protein [Patiriisocius marinus]|uniref:Uncharacterized protein n=1 Tax=Patiriisocius marinus TaxID=1397112 RepID=A0A5J4IZQ6_9FLAO|nr:hypothetical protein [Patiriisocius marinus]GER60022.1 hypothetical protein ULMA_21300 [Patiriisocius marinus]